MLFQLQPETAYVCKVSDLQKLRILSNSSQNFLLVGPTSSA